MDAYIYLISATYVSDARFRNLASLLTDAAPGIARALRIEGTGESLWQALDEVTEGGATRIELRPIGLPFSQSLEKWLPGAAASWLARQQSAHAIVPALYITDPPQADARIVRSAARARVMARRIQPEPNGELGAGWDAPPNFQHHLLVCTGPRCHLKDAPNLVDALKTELGRARLHSACLITTTGCLFPCNAGPVIVHYPHGDWYRISDQRDIRSFVDQVLCAGTVARHLLIHQTGDRHEPA